MYLSSPLPTINRSVKLAFPLLLCVPAVSGRFLFSLLRAPSLSLLAYEERRVSSPAVCVLTTPLF